MKPYLSARIHHRILIVLLFSTPVGLVLSPVGLATTVYPDSALITVSDGWNLISLPLDPIDPLKDHLFPSSVSHAYRYDAGYVASESLRSGVGYWLKSTGQYVDSIDGAASMRSMTYS